MPIYEYWCSKCKRRISLYQQNYSSSSLSCPHCGDSHLKRLFSTFSMHKTYKDVYEDILNDRDLTRGMMRNDPRAMADWNRRMSGGERPPPEFEEITERMDSGEWPVEQLEERKKELYGDDGSIPVTGK